MSWWPRASRVKPAILGKQEADVRPVLDGGWAEQGMREKAVGTLGGPTLSPLGSFFFFPLQASCTRAQGAQGIPSTQEHIYPVPPWLGKQNLATRGWPWWPPNLAVS